MTAIGQVDELEDTTIYGYSAYVRRNNVVYLAGQCGLNEQHEIVSPDFATQARRCFERVEIALAAAGGRLRDVVSMTVFITDARYGRVLTDIRREFFAEPYPASALVTVSQLMPLGALVEVQAIAVIRTEDAV